MPVLHMIYTEDRYYFTEATKIFAPDDDLDDFDEEYFDDDTFD